MATQMQLKVFFFEVNHMASRTFRKKKQQQTKYNSEQQQTKYHSEMKCFFVQ